jgi:hypothetical protein
MQTVVLRILLPTLVFLINFVQFAQLYSLYIFVGEQFDLFCVVLEFELRALHGRQAIYHLSHSSSPFCYGYFGDMNLTFCPG